MSRTLVIGLDAGATSTRCVVATLDGVVVGRGEAGGANRNSSSGRPTGALSAAIEAALSGIPVGVDQRGVPTVGVDRSAVRIGVLGAAGSAGAGRKAFRAAAVEAWSRAGLTGELVTVTDLEVAFAAGTAAAEGTLLLSGTGALAARFAGGVLERRCDGYGWLAGDEGSAVWIGLRALRAVLAALDGRGEPTALVAPVCEQLGIGPPDGPPGATREERRQTGPPAGERDAFPTMGDETPAQIDRPGLPLAPREDGARAERPELSDAERRDGARAERRELPRAERKDRARAEREDGARAEREDGARAGSSCEERPGGEPGEAGPAERDDVAQPSRAEWPGAARDECAPAGLTGWSRAAREELAQAVVAAGFALAPAEFGLLAPAVSAAAEAGDPVARRIADAAAVKLLHTLDTVEPPVGADVVLAGSVLLAPGPIGRAVRAGVRARTGGEAREAVDGAGGAAAVAVARFTGRPVSRVVHARLTGGAGAGRGHEPGREQRG